MNESVKRFEVGNVYTGRVGGQYIGNDESRSVKITRISKNGWITFAPILSVEPASGVPVLGFERSARTYVIRDKGVGVAQCFDARYTFSEQTYCAGLGASRAAYYETVNTAVKLRQAADNVRAMGEACIKLADAMTNALPELYSIAAALDKTGAGEG